MKFFFIGLSIFAFNAMATNTISCKYQVALDYQESTSTYDLEHSSQNVILQDGKRYLAPFQGQNSKKNYMVTLEATLMNTGLHLLFSIDTDYVVSENGVNATLVVQSIGLFSPEQKTLQLQTIVPNGYISLFCSKL